MSDDVKALARRAREIAEAIRNGLAVGNQDAGRIDAAADALEASVQAPAVPSEPPQVILHTLLNSKSEPNSGDLAYEIWGAIIASGILQDASVLAREAEARGLEKAERDLPLFETARWGEHAEVRRWLTARAQQVREGT